MSRNNPNDKEKVNLPNVTGQLSFDFMDQEFSVSPEKVFETPDRLYSFPEFMKRPFFLNKRSLTVKISRKAYNEEEIRKRLSKAKKSDGGSYTEEEINDAVRVDRQDLVKQYEDGWQIRAALDFGLPNETDGHIWDYIAQKVSDVYLSDGRFHSVYFFTEEELVNELIRLGVFSDRGGRQRQIVSDSVSRLMRTVYKLEKSHEKTGQSGEKPTKTNMSLEFTLISAVFRAGQELPDGTKLNKTALAINPTIIQALREDNYIIVANERRRHIKQYGAKALYDRLAFWAYIQFKKNEIAAFRTLKIQPHQVIGYEKLCNLLGIDPLEGTMYKKSRIKRQTASVIDELVDLGAATWVEIEQRTTKGQKKLALFRKINFLYLYQKVENGKSFRTNRSGI